MSCILIIDDDKITQLTLERVLQRQGYEVSIAGDGRTGLELAKQLKPALIICDWEMPQMNGLEVCRQVKAIPELSTGFFILLTARGDSDDRVLGLDSGADDFLSKPPDINELKARVRAGLRSYQLSRALQEQKRLLEAELAEAADYVRSLLPAPISGALSTAWTFLPSARLGGDSFNYHWLDATHFVTYLLDVSGHGVGAALLSASVIHVLKSRSLPQIDFRQPHEVLRALNASFPMSEQNEKYFTIWYGVYDTSSRQLTYASGGHPPALLLAGSSATPAPQQLKTGGLPIGILPDVEFVSHQCELPANSTLYLYSDGIYEVVLADGKLWTLDQFIELAGQQHRQSASLQQILHRIQTLRDRETFDDDLSLLQVQFA
ncbi:MAG: SpoIIE family protein phosphatase [Cyanobacteria bacterium P01_D01_bin.123]